MSERELETVAQAVVEVVSNSLRPPKRDACIMVRAWIRHSPVSYQTFTHPCEHGEATGYEYAVADEPSASFVEAITIKVYTSVVILRHESRRHGNVLAEQVSHVGIGRKSQVLHELWLVVRVVGCVERS
jgi:hypothetical protein